MVTVVSISVRHKFLKLSVLQSRLGIYMVTDQLCLPIRADIAGTRRERSMAGNGYLPTRDEMIAVVRASREFYRVVRRWQSDSQLPGYPTELGNLAATQALFHLERALNPTCLA